MRAFFAIDLPEAVRAEIARVQTTLQRTLRDARSIRWTRPEGIHLTLKFLGEVADSRIADLTNVLRSLEPIEPFSAALVGFGFFPNARQPKVFWAGLDAPPELTELVRRIENAMAAIGFPPEARPFSPHLTVARISERLHPDDIRTMQNGASPDEEPRSPATRLRFSVFEFFLFESRLHPSGAEYRKVAQFPLKRRAHP